MNPALRGTLETLERGGWVGVDLFFVLSGFLVSSLLFEEHQRQGRASIRRFLVRRGLKIYPAFYFYLGCMFGALLWWRGSIPRPTLIGELLALQNYVGYYWGHTWSLAVEEHFYLGLALWIWWLQSRRRHAPFASVPAIFCVVASLCLTLRAWQAWRHPTYEWYRDLAPTHLRIDSLFFGVLLAYAVRYRGLLDSLARFPPAARIATGSLFLLPLFVFSREEHRWISVTGYTLNYIGAGLIVLGLISWQSSQSKTIRFLAALGATSYSIYLWHPPIQFCVDKWLAAVGRPGQFLGYAILYPAVAVGGGFALAHMVEFPILRLRDRFFRTLANRPPLRDLISQSQTN
jgi:peptidoglycan/LPS O-acetylase OafA/YrhL